MDCPAVCWRERFRNCLQAWMTAVKPPGMGSRRVFESFLTIKKGRAFAHPFLVGQKGKLPSCLSFFLYAFEDSRNTLT